VWRKYRDKRTERFANEDYVKAFAGCERQAEMRLTALEAATTLADLRVNRDNRLEPLSGDRSGQWSIRINRQWRICFLWPDNRTGAVEIEIVDCH